MAAFAGGFVATRLGLPPIVGYLLAGIVVGPYTPGGHANAELATQLAEVGVILLMFGVGLHFSVREILDVGPIAIPGAIGQSTVATLLGMGVSLIFGWSFTEGLILGLCLSVASTVVLLRALEERNLLETHSGRVAVGWLIVEDLFTVLILVLLPAVAGSSQASAGLASEIAGGNVALEIALSLGQTVIFVAIMLVFGVKVVPRLLREVVRAGSRELFTLCILALALGVAFGSAELFGASLALGAFLAGMVLNESELSHRAGLEALPLRDAFAVLFFVSVGMIFDPAVLTEQPLLVAAVVGTIIVGKATAAFLIVTLLGYGLRNGLLVAVSLAQVGEFTFILASLAIALDLLPAEANSAVLAGAIISITLNPLLFRHVDELEDLLRRWTWFTRFAGRRQPESEEVLSIRRHVIICGYGRSGSNLARSLSGRELPFVIIESDPFVLERARAAGYTCVFGDATLPVVLEQARVREARSLAVTYAGEPTAPLTVQNAKLLNPDLDIVARASGPESHGLLRQAGASEVVDPYFEASIEFVRHVLHRCGIEGRQISALQARWRAEYYQTSE
ncbi:MAG TPA: cation:proton antiporter [Dehalococcoidia bacterium]|nr:cation:proton antiporter [Dehalococcoidia bacterium]